METEQLVGSVPDGVYDVDQLLKAHVLVFDTETNGFPKANVADDSKAQARVVQFCLGLYTEKMEELLVINTLIKPDCWTIPEVVTKVHGLTDTICEEKGIPQKQLIQNLATILALCPSLKYIVAHNYEFDERMLAIELAQALRDDLVMKDQVNCIGNKLASLSPRCTMEMTTGIVKVPFAGGKKKFGQSYKWPKLSEAYDYFFKEKLEGAHNAVNDIGACARIFKHLVDNKIIVI